jgi:phosphoribosylformylglycinamidine synthase
MNGKLYCLQFSTFHAQASSLEVASLLFGEQPSRVLLSVKPEHRPEVVRRAAEADVPCAELGVTGGTSLSIALVEPHDRGASGVISASIVAGTRDLREAREGCLARIVGNG